MDISLKLILVSVLQFQVGTNGEFIYRYHTLGQEAVLPCGAAFPSDTECHIISWTHTIRPDRFVSVVQNGQAQSARLSVNTECSLVINSITAEDVGFYTCRQGDRDRRGDSAFLSVLTISPSPPDADPQSDAERTLNCRLLMFRESVPCLKDSVRWVNEMGSVLRGEGVRDSVLEGTDCVSVLTVKHQSGHNRRYTCQFVNEGKVEIEADYTPDFTDPPSGRTSITVGAAVGGVVVVLVAIAAVLIIAYRKRAKETEDVQTPTQGPDEPESSLTYLTISHVNHRPSANRTVKEQVTYSTVNTGVKTATSANQK